MSRLADRFRGDDGKEALLQALMFQSIVGGVRDLASAIAARWRWQLRIAAPN